MSKLLLGALLGVTMIANSGCVVPMYSPDPTRRLTQLLNTSENLRMIMDEWERAWLIDMPTHLTPYRVHGGM